MIGKKLNEKKMNGLVMTNEETLKEERYKKDER